jgi:hypothetical protein
MQKTLVVFPDHGVDGRYGDSGMGQWARAQAQGNAPSNIPATGGVSDSGGLPFLGEIWLSLARVRQQPRKLV